VSDQNNITVGDRVRVRYGAHAGEIATVSNITLHSNQFGSYARVRISFEGGEVEERGMDSLEKTGDSARTADAGH
jgi:ribosomal protein L24